MPQEHRDVIEFSFESGCRPGEVCTLKVKDIDTVNRTALIQRTYSGRKVIKENTKQKSKKFIPLSDCAYEIVMRHITNKHPESFLFINSTTGKGYKPDYLSQKLWRKYSELSITFYEASRHSFATQLVELDVDVLSAQLLLRHSDLRSTQRYFHGSINRLRDMVNRRGKVVTLKPNTERMLNE